jgi:hypothetical protein
MRQWIARATLTLLTLTLIGACKGPEVASPLTGTTRMLCCNLYYEKPKITDVGYQVGTRIPFGTRVHIDHVYRNSIDFTPEGHPTITLVYKTGDRAVPFETFLDRLLVDKDPHAALRKVPAKRVEAIESGRIEPGMSKDQVLMTRGIPPAHRTPSLASPSWTYWNTRWDTIIVYFTGDKVERIGH